MMDLLTRTLTPTLILVLLAIWAGVTLKLFVTLRRTKTLNESAWGLVANAWGGDWDKAPKAWQLAASKWREAWLGNGSPLTTREEKLEAEIVELSRENRELERANDRLRTSRVRSIDQADVVGNCEPSHARRALFFNLVSEELNSAYAKHGSPMWGRHEALGVIGEEFREFQTEVDRDGTSEKLVKEMVQTAAMFVRFFETGNRYSDNRFDL